MSRRARSRAAGDKRSMYHAGGSPELERAFATLAALPTGKREESEDDPITLKDGSTVDLAAPWKLPTDERIA